MPSRPPDSVPSIGQVPTVRNRRGIVSQVRPGGGDAVGLVHPADVEFDDGEFPLERSVLCEREAFAQHIPPTALPDPAPPETPRRQGLSSLFPNPASTRPGKVQPV